MGGRRPPLDHALIALPSPELWNGTRVLVTGHSGFKGSWLTAWLRELGAEVQGLSLPQPPTWPSLWSDLGMGIHEVRDDIRGNGWAPEVRRFNPTVAFHLAAQPLVAEGFRTPLGTFDTNVLGVGRLLEAMEGLAELRALVIITTDKVYDTRQAGPFAEGDFLGGRDPYSASKAAAELLAASWPDKTLPIVTARAGNVVGGGDWAGERLVPDLVRAWRRGDTVQLRDISGIRPWQHVLEPIRGYLLYAEALITNRTVSHALNFGPSADDMVSVGEIVRCCAEFWPSNDMGTSPAWAEIKDRPYPETRTLTLDSSRAHDELGWRGLLGWRETIRWTIDWYQGYLREVPAHELVSRDIRSYCEVVEGTQ